MKKYLVAGLLAVTLMIGFAKKADAVQQEYCRTFPVYCGSNFAGYAFECGNTLQQFLDNKAIMIEVICLNN